MSHLWQVIEDEMEALKERNDSMSQLVEALRKERDEFASDVDRLHKASGHTGPTRGRSSL